MNFFQYIYNLLRTDRRLQIIALLLLAYILYRSTRKIVDMNIESIIKRTAQEFGMPENMQLLLVAQAKHETGNFTSNAFIKNKNLYGYKYVSGAQYQLAKGITSSEGNAYASYASIEDSVREVCAWIRRRQNESKFPSDLSSLTAHSYAQLLKNSGYYGDTVANYAKALQNHLT